MMQFVQRFLLIPLFCAPLIVGTFGGANPNPSIPLDTVPRDCFNALFEMWVTNRSDKSIVRLIDPRAMEWPIVKSLREKGFIIESYSDNGKSDELTSKSGAAAVLFTIRYSEIEEDTATFEIRTEWNKGFKLEEYNLRREKRRWKIIQRRIIMIT